MMNEETFTYDMDIKIRTLKSKNLEVYSTQIKKQVFDQDTNIYSMSYRDVF